MNIDKLRRLLVVDDDTLFAESTGIALTDEHTSVATAPSVAAARACFGGSPFDVVLLDNHLADGNGIDLIPEILNANDHAKIIFATAFPSFENAVRAIKRGAYDYISKPVDLDELRSMVERAFEASRLEAIEQVARYENDKKRKRATLAGFGSRAAQMRELIDRAAATKAPVLITGETGTGKNVIAKMIHYLGRDDSSPLINLNCAAIPETLIEAELFGAEKGAYTGATQMRKGIFELADGGTLFLDEIGEMPATLQAKLLTAIEEKRIRRVGGEKDRSVNVRIIAATNAEPEKEIEKGSFRADLFYRLSVIRIHVPPLRERLEDLQDLCAHFIDEFAPNRGIAIADGEIERLRCYDFPGNVRELRNIIERCLILQEGNRIFPSRLVEIRAGEPKRQRALTHERVFKEAVESVMSLSELERSYISTMFERNNGNIARTSKALDISLSTMKRKLQSFGIRRSKSKSSNGSN